MKKESFIRRFAVPLLIILAVLLTVLTGSFAYMTKNACSSWVVNRFNVQERVYEAIGTLYASLQMLVFSSSLLIFTVWGLFRTGDSFRDWFCCSFPAGPCGTGTNRRCH